VLSRYSSTRSSAIPSYSATWRHLRFLDHADMEYRKRLTLYIWIRLAFFQILMFRRK
jgi:hypothetical protein